jgi:DNA modification methylase
MGTSQAKDGAIVDPFLSDTDVTLHHGDACEVLRELPEKSVHMCVTSPPFYGLRDYGVEGQIGLEDTPEEWCQNLVDVFREVKRVLRNDGTLWVEIGDSYNGSGGYAGPDAPINQRRAQGEDWGKMNPASQKALGNKRGVRLPSLKPKDLIGAPWMLAFALRADGWYLRSDIIWNRSNPMPESVTDRPTKSHSYVFLLAKQPRYYWDQEALREPHNPDGRKVTRHPGPGDHSEQERSNGDRWPNSGRNIRTVWEIPTQPLPYDHYAAFPEKLVEKCILAGCPEGGTVLDPFIGSGTTALVARRLNRKSIGIELNETYLRDICLDRLKQLSLLA